MANSKESLDYYLFILFTFCTIYLTFHLLNHNKTGDFLSYQGNNLKKIFIKSNKSSCGKSENVYRLAWAVNDSLRLQRLIWWLSAVQTVTAAFVHLRVISTHQCCHSVWTDMTMWVFRAKQVTSSSPSKSLSLGERIKEDIWQQILQKRLYITLVDEGGWSV